MSSPSPSQQQAITQKIAAQFLTRYNKYLPEINSADDQALFDYFETKTKQLVKTNATRVPDRDQFKDKWIQTIKNCIRETNDVRGCAYKYSVKPSINAEEDLHACMRKAYPAKQGSREIIDKCFKEFDEVTQKEYHRMRKILEQKIEQ